MKYFPAVSVAVVLAVSSSPAAQTGFRNDGAGLYPDAKPAVEWSATSNVIWKTALKNWSNASPVITGDRIFICAEPATLICVAKSNGAILWQDSVTNLPSPVPKTHGANGYTSATPCTDGSKVWTVFGQGVVACWDISGRQLWTVTLEKPPHDWGGCVSPRLAGGVLVVQFNSVFGLDPDTGAEKWKVSTGWGWGSPVVARIENRDIIYTCKGAAIDAADGKELPTQGLPGLDYNSPCLVSNTLYYVQAKPQAFAVPSKLDGKPQPLWKNISIPNDRYYGTPLIHNGLVYAINAKGILSVLDQATGELVYSQKYQFDTAYPSPTLAGDYVFLSCEGGKTAVIKSGRQYTEVAMNTLEKARTTPVFEGTRMYVRGLKYLWCIGSK